MSTSVCIEIQPDILNWVIEKAEREDAGRVVYETLNQWRTGEKTPTFNQIEEISKKARVPFGYFFLQTPPADECEIAEYRTVDSLAIAEPSRDLIDTVDKMTDIQDWMADYYRDMGHDPLRIVGKARSDFSVSQIATLIREELKLKEDWFTESQNANSSFRRIREKAENSGILVMLNGIVGNNTHRKLNIQEFRAFTLINPYAPLIFINSCDTDNGKLFSLLHEITHVWLGTESLYNETYGYGTKVSLEEQLCNAVAAEILVPAAIFKQRWNENVDEIETQVDKLAKLFKCSRAVITRRALEARFINKQTYDSIMKMLKKQYDDWFSERSKRDASGGDFYNSLGSKLDHRFIQAVAQSAKAGRMGYADAYRLTGTTGKTFSTLLEKVGGL